MSDSLLPPDIDRVERRLALAAELEPVGYDGFAAPIYPWQVGTKSPETRG